MTSHRPPRSRSAAVLAVAAVLALLVPAFFAGPTLADDLGDLARASAEFATANGNSQTGVAPLPVTHNVLLKTAAMPNGTAASEPGREPSIAPYGRAEIRPALPARFVAIDPATGIRLDRGPPSPSDR